ncbi:acylamino-acid-releasing enzyme, partial [Biomphalaria glabrata]
GDFIVYHGVVYFSNFTDKFCTVTDPSSVSEPVTDISKKYCFIDGVWSPQGNYALSEDILL